MITLPDERQTISLIKLIDELRRRTTDPTVIRLCDEFLKILQTLALTRRVTASPVTVTDIGNTAPAISVTPPINQKRPPRPRGRPLSGHALTPAQKQAAYRARKKAAAQISHTSPTP